MVDQAKRDTLKNVAGIGIGGLAITTSGNVLAAFSGNVNSAASESSIHDGLAQIQVSSRISSHTNDLEVVLTNSGTGPTTISDLTPAEINTARGRFDFSALLQNGDLTLQAGESVIIPMQHHAVVLDGSALGSRMDDLQRALQRNVSVITDGDSLAAVTVKNALNFA